MCSSVGEYWLWGACTIWWLLKNQQVHLFPRLLHWKQKSTYIYSDLSIRVQLWTAGTRVCKNLRWDLCFLKLCLSSSHHHLDGECTDAARPLLCWHESRGVCAAPYALEEVKNSGPLEWVRTCILCKFRVENISRAWLLNLFGLRFKW